jgi:hypothetical protein
LTAIHKKNERHSSLADLTRYIAQHSPEDVDGGLAGDIGSHSELKSMRYFRNTWAKLSVDRRVAQAIRARSKERWSAQFTSAGASFIRLDAQYLA